MLGVHGVAEIALRDSQGLPLLTIILRNSTLVTRYLATETPDSVRMGTRSERPLHPINVIMSTGFYEQVAG